MKKFLILALVALLGACSRPVQNYTVIISLDGSRWDYADMYDMPFFDSLATVGVKARMAPSYPSSTFPNHYTMATGLVPDHNGLVNNSFWDPETQYEYSMGDSECRFDPHYYLGEPVWVTAQRQGVRAASVYWVGSDIPICGTFPTYYRNWNEDPHWTFEERIDEMVRLLSLPEDERPRLLMGYFDEPDHTGHDFGPYAPETAAKVHEMDSLMNVLYTRLKAIPGVGEHLNFIIAGDHGMTEISPERFIAWDEVIPEGWCDHVVSSIPTSLWVKPEYVDSLYNRLQKVEHLSVWKHGEVPAYLNYGTSNRLGDLIVSPDLGWQFYKKPSSGRGAHGFDCTETDVMVAFRAVGPDFKVGYEAPCTEGEKSAFRNIDLYPMLCKLIGVKPAPVDGDLSRIEKILAK
ncbi:MAG: alkaline phosphatase family protein [Bacteroidales bacterium]|nr:alkaline phosphatase family protein [Bacteroidales bacterium]